MLGLDRVAKNDATGIGLKRRLKVQARAFGFALIPLTL